MSHAIRIGTRESQLAVWQATTVQGLLQANGHTAELVFIKSDGDTDLQTPLYEMGVQGIFTRALDIALLQGTIDIAVHSMKDVPTAMARGLMQAAVLPRASHHDIFVPGPGCPADLHLVGRSAAYTIATSSIRRKAQWLHRFPADNLDNLRGNVNTRLRKVAESTWAGAIFAAAGLERIGLRPEAAITLDWMLPAPAQGAILIACRETDIAMQDACAPLNHAPTALCTGLERSFLRALMGGCATPISALAEVEAGQVIFKGSLLSPDGKKKLETTMQAPVAAASNIGADAAAYIMDNGGAQLLSQPE